MGIWRGPSWLGAGKHCQIFRKGRKVDPGNYMSVSFTSVPGKIKEKIVLGVTEKHHRDHVVTGHRQRRFGRGRFQLTNLISFHDKVTHS